MSGRHCTGGAEGVMRSKHMVLFTVTLFFRWIDCRPVVSMRAAPKRCTVHVCKVEVKGAGQ